MAIETKINKRQREILTQLTQGHVLREAAGNWGKHSFAIIDMTRYLGNSKKPGVFVSNVTEACFQKIKTNGWVKLSNSGWHCWDYSITEEGGKALI